LLTRDSAALRHLSNDRVTVCEGDLLKPSTLDGFLLPGSTLIHLAYLHRGRDANIEAAVNIARAALRSGVKRVVHCSSAVVVGFDARGVVTEDTAASPKGEYQETKYAIEQIFRRELLPYVELAILRPTEIIGAGGLGLRRMIQRLVDRPRPINAIYRVMLKARRFNYVSVQNVVAALMVLASSPLNQKADVYYISDDDDPDNNYAAVEEIINCALDVRPRHRSLDIGLPPSALSLLFKLLPGSAPPDRLYSNFKIKTLGYRKVTTLRSAILDVIAYEKSRSCPAAASSSQH
jgi:nucleoside-diphosphate-sugar epimerase